MEPVVVIGLVVALVVAVLILGLRRRPRQDDGMQTFRRHIDALSPEARREVMDRARRHEASRGPDGAGVLRGPVAPDRTPEVAQPDATTPDATTPDAVANGRAQDTAGAGGSDASGATDGSSTTDSTGDGGVGGD